MPESNDERDFGRQLRQARSELEQGLRAGENCRAEQIFARYPALAADSDSALEIIYSTEYTLRELLGEEPSPEEYYDRFPQYRQGLEELFRLQDLVRGEEDDLDSPERLDLPVEGGTDWGVEHFQVLEALGQNGPVVVFKARQVSHDRLVAVKMVAKNQTPPEEVDRFRRACADQARLRHPHIVRVYDRGEDEVDVFFTMEFGAGGTLAQRIGGRPLPTEETARILHALAGAVQYAHEQKIIHRDLKPTNVVLTSDGTPQITDFGLAKRLEAESGPTRSGQLLGTPPYMAPEQADGRTAPDARTDVYGLGAVLYEALTGRPPFQGKNELDTLLQVRRCRVLPPHRRNRSVDRRLESICLKCLERRPRRRYPSAGALADDLERWQRRERPRAHGVAARTSRLVRRHPRLTSVLLLGLAVLSAGVIDYLASQERALRLALARLAEGEEVTWIGKTGKPLFCRPVLPYKDVIVGRSDDGAFVFGSETIGLLELVPDPQHSHYVFSAEVRRQDLSPDGEVGIYLLYSQHGAPERPLWRHWYCVVKFNDSPEAPKRSMGLMVEHHFEPSNQSQSIADESIPCPMCSERKWHKIVVEVSPTEVKVEYDDRPLPTTSRERLNILTDMLYDELLGLRDPEPAPALGPRSSLGLYADQGSASFRNVVVKPLTLVLER
jgi:serine/threonine-protein kinase